jgi:hypothetical protein
VQTSVRPGLWGSQGREVDGAVLDCSPNVLEEHSASIFRAEDSIFPRNFVTRIPVYVMSQPRTTSSSIKPPFLFLPSESYISIHHFKDSREENKYVFLFNRFLKFFFSCLRVMSALCFIHWHFMTVECLCAVTVVMEPERYQTEICCLWIKYN